MRHAVLTRIWWPPLFREQPPALGLLNVVAPPVLWGLLCGALSGTSYGAFMTGVALSFVGAFVAGRQHDETFSGLTRGLVAGTLFGLAVLLGRAFVGGGALMFDPPFLQVMSTAAIAASLGALGGTSRSHEPSRIAASRGPRSQEMRRAAPEVDDA